MDKITREELTHKIAVEMAMKRANDIDITPWSEMSREDKISMINASYSEAEIAVNIATEMFKAGYWLAHPTFGNYPGEYIPDYERTRLNELLTENGLIPDKKN